MKSKAKDELLEFSSEESLSEDDEDGWKLTENVEKDFYKTLSQIKNKDPKIYEKDRKFFENIPESENKVAKKTKSNPFTLRDYERKIILEKGGELSDEDNPKKEVQPTYVEEQESLKNSLKAFVKSDSEEENDESWGGLFKKREKTEKEKKEDEEYYKEWLKGQKKNAPDEEIEKDMRTLRDYWTDPKLNENDQFLRDYVLNKKFLERNDEDESRENVEKILEESQESQTKEEFEGKLSHHFEESDQEYIKRYPRVMENSFRRKNEHRKQKRIEVKERKLKEKEKKRVDIKHKKKLKKKEIEDKIEELKALTGNDKLAFENVLDQDFDFDEHDRAMQRLFNEEFYSQDDPNFKPNDYMGSEEAWKEEENTESGELFEENEQHCEDPNFNMDCDYDPMQKNLKEKVSRSRRRKDKHRRTTVSEAVKREKPLFDPTTHESFQGYIDQYYAIDCEDFIGDLPCRFKYRRTVPNSYGLTIEEILAADSKELERWCSIKRIHQQRPEYKEKCDVKVYQKKAADEKLKRKLLPSLFKPYHEMEDTNKTQSKAKTQNEDGAEDHETDDISTTRNEPEITTSEGLSKSKRKKNKQKLSVPVLTKIEKSTEPKSTVKEKLSKNKKKKHKTVQKLDIGKDNGEETSSRKRKLEMTEIFTNKKKKSSSSSTNVTGKRPIKTSKHIKNNNTKENKTSKESHLIELSDARLLAYGIKPKKFRNKLKYNKGKL